MSSKLQRLFIKSPLVAGGAVALDKDQAHYLGNVLRLKPGERLLLFNGKDGPAEKGGAPVVLFLPPPGTPPRLDYMAQKATEMGVSALRPVITRHTVAERVKTGRLLANAIEAAEQCGILRVPEVMEPENLSKLIGAWDEERLLIFADEAAPHASPIEALKARGPGPVAVLIGPEGGFEREERAALLAKPFVLPISLGPRVMRADTAAVAALALVNAALGDWR